MLCRKHFRMPQFNYKLELCGLIHPEMIFVPIWQTRKLRSVANVGEYITEEQLTSCSGENYTQHASSKMAILHENH